MTELAESCWTLERRPWRSVSGPQGNTLFLRSEARILGKLLTDQGFIVDLNINDEWPRGHGRPAIILAWHKRRSAMTMFALKHDCKTLIITPYSK
jgi:hypothetical protein